MASKTRLTLLDRKTGDEEFEAELNRLTLCAIDGRCYVRVEKLKKWLRKKSSFNGQQNLVRLFAKCDPSHWDIEVGMWTEDEKTRIDLVFSILLCVGAERFYKDFRNRELFDSRLPIDLYKLRGVFKSLQVEQSDTLAKSFDDIQWAFCPRVFDISTKEETPKRILPINRMEILVRDGDDAIQKGGTAELYHIEVFEDFLSQGIKDAIDRSPTSRPPSRSNAVDQEGSNHRKTYDLVLKTFGLGHTQQWEKERTAFKMMGDQKRFIQYFGDFKLEDIRNVSIESRGAPKTETRQIRELNILLELGDFDLEDFFSDEIYPLYLRDSIQTFWSEIFGICEAVEQFHSLTRLRGGVMMEHKGMHADIKPANILSIGGRFKLADPGFADFRRNTGKDVKFIFEGGTKTYGAPECYKGKHEVDQKVDIWSLGCVFSVAATWVVLGQPGVRQYKILRQNAVKNVVSSRESQQDATVMELKGHEMFHNGETVLPEVYEWHKFVRSSMRNCDDITGKVLNIVEEHMLQRDPAKRHKAGELCKELNITFKKDIPDPVLDDSGTHTGASQIAASVTKALDQDDAVNVRHSYEGSSILASISRVNGKVLEVAKQRKMAKIADHKSEYIKSALQSQTASQAHPSTGVGAPLVPPVPVLPANKDQAMVAMPATSESTHKLSPQEALRPRRIPTSLRLEPDNHEPQDVWQAREAIQKVKNDRKLTEKLRGKWNVDLCLEHFFKNRDIVFLVDNAETMRKWWYQASYLLETLVMKAKGIDPDGMDLIIPNSTTGVRMVLEKSQDPNEFWKAMQDPSNGPRKNLKTNMCKALGSVFKDHLTKVESPKLLEETKSKSNIITRLKKSDKIKEATNMMLIVLTDGLWALTERNELEKQIIDFVKRLQEVTGDLADRSFAIQFIRFGHNPYAETFLNHLDDEMKYEGIPDIIDTEPALGGDVYKMLLGGFVPEIDSMDNIVSDLESSIPGTQKSAQKLGPDAFPPTNRSVTYRSSIVLTSSAAGNGAEVANKRESTTQPVFQITVSEDQ